MGLDEELDALIKEGRSSSVVASNMDKVLKKIKKEQSSKNYKLLRCIFFPEYSKGARFPSPYAIESGVYSVRSEYTVRTNAMTRAFGLVVNPYSRGVTDHPVHYFANATMEDWGRSVKLNPYSSNDLNPLFPPEVFFSKSRLISCAVSVEPLSEESSGRFKGGLEYDINDEFIRPNRDLQQQFQIMLGNAYRETLIYYSVAKVIEYIKTRPANPIANPTEQDIITQCNAELGGNVPRTSADAAGIVWSNIANKLNFPEYLNLANAGLTESNLLDKVMKAWRKTMKEPSLNNLYTTGLLQYLSTVSSTNTNMGAGLASYYTNVTYDYIEFKARCAAQMYTDNYVSLDSDQYRGSTLNYQRLQMLSYRNETPFDEGIRVVYIPKYFHTLNYDSNPSDLVVIGGMQLPAQCALKISVVRHFEGIPHRGMTSIYPVLEQPEDEKIVKMIETLAKKNPDLLRIPIKELPTMYKIMKSRFKWVDTTLREDGTGFEVVRDFMAPSNMQDILEE